MKPVDEPKVFCVVTSEGEPLELKADESDADDSHRGEAGL